MPSLFEAFFLHYLTNSINVARVKTSVIVASIEGKIGGSVFQRTRSGLVLKANNKKVNKNTVAQSLLKSVTASMQSQWFQLSDQDRQLWLTFAKFARVQHRNSTQFILNGQQLFLKANIVRTLYSQSLLNPPEFSKCIALPVTFSPSLSGGDLLLNASRLVDSTVEFVVCYATVPVSPTVNNPGSRYRLMVFSTTTDTVFDISAAYISVFGRKPVSGETIFTKAFVANKLTGLFTVASVAKKLL